MTRRSWFATLLAPLAARFLPKKPAGSKIWWTEDGRIQQYECGVDLASAESVTIVTHYLPNGLVAVDYGNGDVDVFRPPAHWHGKVPFTKLRDRA